jgi:16S rRNA G527 N7-methylase RsmG
MITFKVKVQELINDKNIFQKMVDYVTLIEEYNKVMNLTGFSGDKL